jgi:hypothetical protein
MQRRRRGAAKIQHHKQCARERANRNMIH